MTADDDGLQVSRVDASSANNGISNKFKATRRWFRKPFNEKNPIIVLGNLHHCTSTSSRSLFSGGVPAPAPPFQSPPLGAEMPPTALPPLPLPPLPPLSSSLSLHSLYIKEFWDDGITKAYSYIEY